MAPQDSAPLVLVVDDVEDSRDLYQQYLEFVGYRVIAEADGAKALECAERQRPDAIVMDLSMPVLDGWEATRRLKASPAMRAIPVIVVTGHALKGAEASARKAGADYYLTKPCLPVDLEKVLEGALQRTRKLAS